MRSLWIFLYLIGVQIGSYYTLGQNFKGYVQTSDMGWFEARRRCIEDGNADMFDPSQRKHLKQSHVVNNTYYWVGGFETSQWRWTDNSPLFTNVGFCDVPTDLENEDIKDIPYNSVLGCYRKCKKYRIGLIGSSCYCLDQIDRSTCSKERGNITMCFGNPMDQCGTESSMSVYHVDVPFIPDGDANYQCAYSKLYRYRYKYRYHYYIELHPYDCDKSLSSICDEEANKEFDKCQNRLCLSTHTASWTSSNQSCSLAKFSSSKINDFIDLQRYYVYNWYRYWIGLHKQRSRHWVDGKTEQLDFGNSDHDLRCLALMKTDGRWSEYWIPCNENHHSLCSSEEHSDTMDTTMETRSSTGKDNEIPGTTSETTEESQIGEDQALKGNDNGKIGIYVGVSVACLLLLATICIAVVLKRKGLFFFKRQEDNKTIAMENTTYMCPDNHKNQDTIHGYQRSVSGQTTNLQRPDIVDQKVSSEEQDYYNTTTALPKSIGGSNLYDHLGADEENYDTAGVLKVDNVTDNTYDHTKPHDDAQMFMVNNEQATYDRTGPQGGSNVKVDNEHDTYNHTGPRGGSNEMVNKERDTCNQTEINHVVNVDKGLSRENVETYNHLRVSGSDKSTLDTGQCYSHLVVDADRDYDTIRPVADNGTSETYSRTSLTGESQGTDAEMKKQNENRNAENSSDYYNL